MCGGNKNTTSSASAPSTAAMSAYSNLLPQIQGVANTTMNSTVPTQGVAPLNAQQDTGIGGVNQYAYSAQPDIGVAEGLMYNNAQPISEGDISQYENPFTQQVVNATQAQFNNQNQQQQQQVVGNAISQHAFGGNREAVAQAEMANQQQLAQAPVIAGLESQGYTQGVSTAEAEQQAGQAGAYGLANVGVAGQTAGLTGANAQIGAGTLEQQVQQAEQNALYQQAMQQFGLPMGVTGWEAGATTGVGSQMGGTSTTTAPNPNYLNTILGGATSAAGMLGAAGILAAAAGGRINGDKAAETRDAIKRFLGGVAAYYRGGAVGIAPGFDTGGGVMSGMPYTTPNWLPSMPITHGRGAPPAPGAPQQPSQPNLQNQAKQIGQLAKTIQNPSAGTPTDIASPAASGVAPTPAGATVPLGLPTGDLPPIYARGGVVPSFADGGGSDGIPSDLQYLLAQPAPASGGDAAAPTGIPSDLQYLVAPQLPGGDAAASPALGPGIPSDLQYLTSTPAAPEAATGVVPMPRPRPADAPQPSSVDPDGGVTPSGDRYGQNDSKYGLPPGYSATTSRLESRGNPNAYNRSGAAGEFQIMPKTARDLGINDAARFDPDVSLDAAGRLAQRNQMELRRSLGRDPTAAELYLAHQQGADGAARIINNPDALAANTVGLKAVVQNGGTQGMTNAEFARHWGNQYGGEPGSGQLGTRAASLNTGVAPTPGVMPATAPAASGVAPSRRGIDWSADSKLWPALISAGGTMMASHSPYLGIATGEGVMSGATTYAAEKAEQQAGGFKQQQIDLESRKLDQELKRHQDDLNLRTKPYSELTLEQKTQAALNERKLALEQQQRNVQALQPVKIGTDELGRDKYAIRDPKTGQLTPVDPSLLRTPVPAAPPNYVIPGQQGKGEEDASIPSKAILTAGGHAEGTNPEVLSTLPPGVANTVKAIAEGRQSLQTVPMRDRGIYQTYVNQYDPNWDQTTWRARNNMQADMATGNTGKLILATNQLLPHLKTASDAAEALKNSNFPAENSIANWFATQTGDPRIKQFDTVRTVAATDAARLLRGTGAMAESEIKGWEERLKASGSPAQLQGVLSLLGDDLMGARIGSIQHQYKTVMGKEAPDFVSPEAKAALEVLRKRNPNAPAASETAHPTSTPAVARPSSVPAGAQYSPSRNMWRDQAGKVYDAQGNPVQ